MARVDAAVDRVLLKPRDLAELQRVLLAHVPLAAVWAYGSRVRGRAHEGSDLDLTLRGLDLGPAEMAALRADLSDSSLPFLVDVHLWSELPVTFQQEIDRTAVPWSEIQSQVPPT